MDRKINVGFVLFTIYLTIILYRVLRLPPVRLDIARAIYASLKHYMWFNIYLAEVFVIL